MSYDPEYTFAAVDDIIRCPICDLLAYEWKVCAKCEQKVGISCCSDVNGETICNECKDQ